MRRRLLWGAVAALGGLALPFLLDTTRPFCGFVSSDGGFEDGVVPFKNRTLAAVEQYFADYQAQPGNESVVLLRTTRRNWWCYWRWHDYLTEPKWDYPLREP